MGNVAGGLDSLCVGRGDSEFVPPNKEFVTYDFNYKSAPGGTVAFKEGPGKVQAWGYQLGTQCQASRGRAVPKWKTIKEHLRAPTALHLRVSGRFLVQCEDVVQDARGGPESICVFKFCTRGRAVYESVRTKNFTHTAPVVTTGIFFALFITATGNGYCLHPKLMLVMESGEEMALVEDKLGPCRFPQSFYADFAALDLGGRDLQMDLIIRGLPCNSARGGEDGVGKARSPTSGRASFRGLRTLRTCLQDYTTFNSEVACASIALGSSDLQALMPNGSVHLQHFVISEEPAPGFEAFLGHPAGTESSGGPSLPAVASSVCEVGMGSEDPVPATLSLPPPPSPRSKAGAQRSRAPPPLPPAPGPQSWPEAVVLYEGAGLRAPAPQQAPPQAATTKATGAEAAEASELPPALVRAMAAGGHVDGKYWVDELSRVFAEARRPSPRRSGSGTPDSWGRSNAGEDFWYHVKYGAADGDAERERARQHVDEHLQPVRGEFWLSKESIDKKHVYFSCTSTLAQALTMCIIFRFSCPTDYLALIETQAAPVLRDLHIPTNGVVLGVEEDPRRRSLFRMFIEHRNEIVEDMIVCQAQPWELSRVAVRQEVYDSGSHISYRLTLLWPDGSWQQAPLQLSADRVEDSLDKAVNSYPLIEDPSARFPISPCLSKQLLSPANRVFVYTSCEYEPTKECDSVDEAAIDAAAFSTPTIGDRTCKDWGSMSEGTAEDWQSAGGGQSDGEGEPVSKATPEPPAVCWSRPLIESVLLAGRVEEPPFRVPPMPGHS